MSGNFAVSKFSQFRGIPTDFWSEHEKKNLVLNQNMLKPQYLSKNKLVK